MPSPRRALRRPAAAPAAAPGDRRPAPACAIPWTLRLPGPPYCPSRQGRPGKRYLFAAPLAGPLELDERCRVVEDGVRALLEKYRRAGGDGARIGAAATKSGYVLPLLRSLGWGEEKGGGAGVTDEALASGGSVDYGLAADGLPAIYVAARGMGAESLDRREWIVRASNYSWLKGAAWAILTNFRVLKVINAGARVSTPASVQLFEIKCGDMLDARTLDRLLLLSRESVAGGGLLKEARHAGASAAAMQVDRRLRLDLSAAHEMLARSIVRNNSGVREGEGLDESVGRILSRLVFVRALEDRGMSEPVLMPLAKRAEARRRARRGGRSDMAVCRGLRREFRRLDKAYGASLFAPHECDRLDITDYTLGRVIGMLHTSEAQLQRYDFSVLDVGILGGVCELHLDEVDSRRRTGGGRGAQRLAHAPYRAPGAMAGFMADALVGYLVGDGQDPAAMRVCDPMCGSGALLARCARAIGAERCGRAAASASASASGGGGRPGRRPACIPGSAALGRMTARAAAENVFGIDPDGAAVDRARLSLLLCGSRRRRGGGAAGLPALRDTVRLGNSLVDPSAGPDVDANPFGWDGRFSDAFDGVVSSPPHVGSRLMGAAAREWFSKEYASAAGRYDSHVLFVERALARVRDGGYVVFIAPNKYAVAAHGAALRRHILKTARIRMIVDVSDARLLPDPGVRPWITVLQREPRAERRRYNTVLVGRAREADASPYACRFASVPQAAFEGGPDNAFYVDAPDRGRGGGGASGGGRGAG